MSLSLAGKTALVTGAFGIPTAHPLLHAYDSILASPIAPLRLQSLHRSQGLRKASDLGCSKL